MNTLGVEIVAIAPDLPEKLQETINAKKLNFPIYSDSKIEVAEAFGIAFHMDDETVSRYLAEYKIDIEKDSGETHHNLPVPAVYVVDKEKKVFYSYVNPDYKIRLDNNQLLEQVKVMLS